MAIRAFVAPLYDAISSLGSFKREPLRTVPHGIGSASRRALKPKATSLGSQRLGSPGDLSGAVIAGKYELLRRIGRGGMGAVYEGRNTTSLRRCAVKLLLTPELAGDDEVVKRFFREARASGLIESDHVVPAHDSGVDAAGHVYYVMDCLEGEDLQQALRRIGAINPIAAAKIILHATNGLAAAHALGIVHRDVKPANLFLSRGEDGEIKVKILDFGVAKVKMEVFHESSHALTRTGSMLGTPLYMSPEQVRRASAIDESADVWSLGVVLFECLSGRTPWGAVESVGELIAAVLTQELPLLQDHAPWVHPDLARLVHGALSRDPQSRMRSASELRASLRAYIAGDPRLYEHELTPVSELQRASLAERLSLADTMTLPAERNSSGPVVDSSRPNPPRFGWAWATVAVLGLLVAIAWTLLSWRSPPSQSGPPPVPAVPNVPPTAAAPPSPPPIENKSVLLRVGPAGVNASVDNVSTAVIDGRVAIVGPVGSIHIVTLKRGNRVLSERIVVTSDGPFPAAMALESAVRQPASARSSNASPAQSGTSPATQGNLRPWSGEADGGLTTTFE